MSEQPTTQPIEIPKALSDKLPDGGRYVRLLRGQKKAIDDKWSTEPRRLDDPELQKWIKEGNNYGVVGGFGLIIIDVDDDELKQAAQDKLPDTFTVQTPGHNGWHLYYLGSLDQPIRLQESDKVDEDGKTKSVGEISAEGRLVVGPGCVHPNGKTYVILKDTTLAKVTGKQIRNAFRPWMIHEKKPKEKEDSDEEENEAKKKGIEIDITKVFDCSKQEGFKQHGDQWQGPHPIHGSETGTNFNVNVKENVWHCFRCDSGGGPLELLAVLEKIANCKDFVKGAHILKTDRQLWQKVRAIAIQKGLVDKDQFITKVGTQTNQAERLVGYVLNDTTVFHDDLNEGYVRCANGAPAIYRIRSTTFKQWAAKAFYEVEGTVPNPEALSSAINVLEGMARFTKPLCKLYNRVAPDPFNDGIWYDLSNAANQVVHITKKGWKVVDDPPILFRRYQHQAPQVLPQHGGNIKDFLDFVPPGIKAKLEDQHKDIGDVSNLAYLLLVDMISKFVPDIPHAILVIYGWHGSAKTYLSRFIKRLIDPSNAETLSMKRNTEQLIQQLSHHYAPNFDNISSLTPWQSDELSRAVTGSGSSKRELYSDDEDVIYQFRRTIMINGINEVVDKPDLLDRSLLAETPNMKANERKEEKILNASFEAKRPGILGAVFTVLSQALKIVDDLKFNTLPRMADYTRWCCAISQALGYNPNVFLDLYQKNVDKQVDEAIKGNPLANVLVKYLDELSKDVKADTEDKEVLYAAVNDLYEIMKDRAKSANVNVKHDPEWPKNASAMSRKLNESGSNFLSLGYIIKHGKADRGTRIVRVMKIASLASLNTGRVETQTAQASTRDPTRDATETRLGDRENAVSTVVSPGTPRNIDGNSILRRRDGRDGRDDQKHTPTGIGDIETFLRDQPSHSIGFTALCEEFGLSDKQLDAFIEESNFLTTALNGQIVKYQEPRQFNCEKCGERLVFETPPNPTGEEASFSIECESCHTQNIFVYGQNGIVQTKLRVGQPGGAIKFHCLACDKGDIQVDGDAVGRPRS